MSTPYTRTRSIDPRDKRNKFAKHDNSDVMNYVSLYCKNIVNKIIKILKHIMKFTYKIIMWLIDESSSSSSFSKKTHSSGFVDMDQFKARDKPCQGVFMFDELYEPKDKVFAAFKKMHHDMQMKYHSGDFRGCMAASRKYINEMNSPAYMNYVRLSVNEKEFAQITSMMQDAYKYGNDALLVSMTF